MGKRHCYKCGQYLDCLDRDLYPGESRLCYSCEHELAAGEVVYIYKKVAIPTEETIAVRKDNPKKCHEDCNRQRNDLTRCALTEEWDKTHGGERTDLCINLFGEGDE